MRCVVGGSRVLQQQKKGSVQLQTVTKVQDLVLYVTHQDENGYWINVLSIGTHVAPNKTFCSQETKAVHAFATKQERERRREGWWFLKVVHCWSRTLIWYQAKMRKAAASCLSTCWQRDSQLVFHKQQWHNNDRNNNCNDNNGCNYAKNHNTAAATDAVANFFFQGCAELAQQHCNHTITDVTNVKELVEEYLWLSASLAMPLWWQYNKGVIKGWKTKERTRSPDKKGKNNSFDINMSSICFIGHFASGTDWPKSTIKAAAETTNYLELRKKISRGFSNMK